MKIVGRILLINVHIYLLGSALRELQTNLFHRSLCVHKLDSKDESFCIGYEASRSLLGAWEEEGEQTFHSFGHRSFHKILCFCCYSYNLHNLLYQNSFEVQDELGCFV